MKHCSKCEQDLDEESFSIRRASKDGRSTWCRACMSAYRKTPERRTVERERLNRWREENREKNRDYGRKTHRAKTLKKYGLTEADYEERVVAQGGKCLICEKTPNDRLVVDHCHDSGAVRGLLCRKCNAAIGQLGDDPVLLRRAADYLTRNTTA